MISRLNSKGHSYNTEEEASSIQIMHLKTLRMDSFMQNNNCYLLVAKYSSKFPWVQKLSATLPKLCNLCYELLFTERDTPHDVMCDSGTQFRSKQYKEIATELGFTLNISCPHSPTCHSFIMKQVQTRRELLSRCGEYASSC